MSEKEIPKAYEPAQFEDDIYRSWEQSGFFNPDNLSGEPYSIMMPPPNVTGVLHLGHALENSLMDTMIRYQRMRGKKALLVPGTDHAAIATQAKVEKILQDQGIKNPRAELGREGLLGKVREYAEESKATILKQIKKMGTSCDWSRLAYTFDEERSRAVNEVFVNMYNDGLIYRGHRVINWSVKGQSTCSDDELIYVDREAKLYTFKYSKDFPITIATTRPETKLGDTAVAVNPADERYQQYIGQTFTVDVGAEKPLAIKIIADQNVEKDFGTGALGVTPAHSAIDYEMHEKQKALGVPIGMIQVIDENGKMMASAGAGYAGLSVLEAREKFVAWLDQQGLLEKTEDITQSVGTSDRFGDVVEALPKTQWFIDMNRVIPARGKSLKDLLREAVTTGHNGDPEQTVRISPERYENIYLKWLDGLRDWCISRQIWWGHRIPVWYRTKADKTVETYCGHEAPSGEGWEQDEDTLDTWFSSGMWTFSTLGYPNETVDLKTFEPTSWMQMGYEIFYLWMVRMIMMSTYAIDQIPFKNVYIHGILRDEHGKKFSKSSGNNIDPLEVIGKYGTDALRLSVMTGIAPGNDSKYYVEKVEAGRNLVNKLWNITRFVATSYGFDKKYFEGASTIGAKATDADFWILNKFQDLVREVTDDFERYQFSQAQEKLRVFTWDDLADWYLEASKFEKSEAKQAVLNYIIYNLLKLWHPFIPFVTEVIWREILGEEMLLVAHWPTDYSIKVETDFETVIDIVKSIRNARSENKVEPAKKVKAVIYGGSRTDFLANQAVLIKNLKTGIEEIEILEKGEKLADAIYIAVGEVEIQLLGAIDKEKELERIKKEIIEKEKFVTSLANKLANEEFVRNAPEKIVNLEKAKLETAQGELNKLKEKLS
jgi:valyl-tRNA synthetase